LCEASLLKTRKLPKGQIQWNISKRFEALVSTYYFEALGLKKESPTLRIQLRCQMEMSNLKELEVQVIP
jgi:hypothetical protein